MDNDKINKYINNHRDDLDQDTPPEDMWDNIDAALDDDTPDKKKGGWFSLGRVASIALLLGLGYVGFSLLSEDEEPDYNYVGEMQEALNDRRSINFQSNPSFKSEPAENTETEHGRVLSNQVNGQVSPLDSNCETEVFADACGGTPVYSYTWSNTADGQTVSGSVAGSYSVTSNSGNAMPVTGSYSFSHDLSTSNNEYNGVNGITGWNYDNPQNGGFEKTPYEEQETGPGLLLEMDNKKLAYGYQDRSNHNESYKAIYENQFKAPKEEPLSTFSIDVDKAGYSNMRRFLNDGQRPPADAVKIEEMINYFDYQYKQPTGDHPFSISTEMHACPWNREHQLIKIGLKGKVMDNAELPASNLVFLIDVSGSMFDENKLPLLKQGFELLVNELREEDRVSIVVYAGSSGIVLEPTSGANKGKILSALNNLEAGGSTAGGAGIQLAYKVASEQFKRGGNNRVILATDGDFNVGASSDEAMVRLIEEKRKSGIFLSVLGFGSGNLQDSKMEQMADNGNGNYSYIDNVMEAKKVFVTEFGGTLFTIAKDVKLQLEFNPSQVAAYRLIGYENRVMAAEDFDNDLKDAGELGAGHTVTALYEIIPADAEAVAQSNADLRYQKVLVNDNLSSELMTIKFRYKRPDGNKSILLSHSVKKGINPWMSRDYAFASSVAQFGLIMRGSRFRANSNFKDILRLAYYGKGDDPHGYRAEYIELVKQARRMMVAQ